MNNLKLALKLSYDGKAVTSGARANAADIAQLDRSTQGAGKAANKTSAQLKQLSQSTRGASQVALQASRHSRSQASGLRVVEQQARQTSRAVSEASRGNKTLARSYTLVASAVSGFLALSTAQSIVRNIAQTQQLNVRLQSLTASSREYGQVQEYLFALADRHNKQYLTLADSYSRILNLQKAGIVTQTEGRDILEGMSNAASALGASNAKLEQSLFGMTQGFTAGTLRAEELNQVTEPLPGLMQQLDKASNNVAGGFRKMVNDGQVTSTMFKQVLIKALQEYQGAGEKMANTIPGGLARVQTAYSRLVQVMEQPVNSALVPALDAVTGMINGLAASETSLDTVGNGAIALSLILGGRLASSLTLSTQKLVAKTVATQAALKEDARLAQQQIVLAQSARHRALQEQAAGQRQLANAKTTYARTSAIKNLAIANGQAAASERALAAATNTYAVAAKRANIAVRTLKGAMALLGGPAGIAMLAAWAIYEFATRADDAAKPTEQLKKHIYNLSEAFDSFNNVSARSKITVNSNAISNYTNKIKSTRAEIARLVTLEKNTSSQRSKHTYKIQIQSLQDYMKTQQDLRGELMKSNDELANFDDNLDNIKWDSPKTKPKATPAPPLSKGDEAALAKVEQLFKSQEQRLRDSYVNRQAIVDKALQAQNISQQRYDELSMLLEMKRDQDIAAFKEQQAEERKNKEQQLTDAQIQRELNAREKADQKRRDDWDKELAGLEGFNSRKEAEEAAHQDRKRQIQQRHAGEYGGVVQQFVALDRASGADRVAIASEIGSQLTGKMAQHSKKAFALNQAMGIAQATIQTYIAATRALAELGPIAGPIAAGVITVMGLANVAMIAKQKPPGYYHGGKIGQTQNIIEFGERNKPEVLEFEGRNYLLGGNGGAVFNRSQLQSANGQGGAVGGVQLTVQLIEDASRAGKATQEKGLNGEDVIRIFVSDIRQGGDSSDAMELTYGLQRTGT